MKLKVIASIMLLLAFTIFSSGLQSVSAPAIPITPIGTTITVASNETFTLAFKMRFDELDVGFFVITFYWDNNETDPNAPYWNFTYEGFKCWFTDGANFSGPIDVDTRKWNDTFPTRYIIQIAQAYGEPPYGEPHNGEFWVNVTMRAAGVVNGTYIPHADGDQNITISKVRCYESSRVEAGPGNTTIHVGLAPPPPPPAPPLAPMIIDTPINDTITVVSGETFVLPFKMKFNETGTPPYDYYGYFSVTFYWDNDETDLSAPYWNFTYEDFVCKFTDGTAFSVPIDATIEKRVPDGYPSGYYRYMITIYETDGEPYNGDFWVNVTMRAAGVINGVYYPHAEGDQNITIVSVRCVEYHSAHASGICTIHVIPLPAVGGNIVPINKLELLMPYVGIASVILVTMTVVVRKRRLNH